ncbi:MAG: hypothetical protein HN921_12315 [Bacteroidetes bacterium]|jgi:hypothetical protein|nr:hypothetical protein [Bacteroidota bacterium]
MATKKKAGRPKKEFDLQQVKLLGQFRATYSTMADWFECSEDTIRRNMQNEKSGFCKVYKKALATTKMKLSEAQIKYALNGNATLLVWLGKNLLDQHDKLEVSSNKKQVEKIEWL